MVQNRRLVNDPRIMEPLEEFLRTVREVVELPGSNEEKVESPSPEFLTAKKKNFGFYQW